MRARKIDVSALTISEILSILEISEGYWGVHSDWGQLKKRLASQNSWLLMDKERIVGCAQLVNTRTLMDDSFLLTDFIYRWEYNTEVYIHQMLQAVINICPSNASFLLLDINCKHDCNYTYYRHFGFQDSFLRSPSDRENLVLIKQLNK